MVTEVPAGPDYPAITAPNDLVADYIAARHARDEAQERVDAIGELLIKQMEADQRKTYKWSGEGLSRAVTYVVKRTSIIDEPGLRKALTAKVYDRYTKKVLDRRAMEAAMEAGDLDQITISPYVSVKASKPYLEYREKEVDK